MIAGQVGETDSDSGAILRSASETETDSRATEGLGIGGIQYDQWDKGKSQKEVRSTRSSKASKGEEVR